MKSAKIASKEYKSLQKNNKPNKGNGGVRWEEARGRGERQRDCKCKTTLLLTDESKYFPFWGKE